MLTNVNNVDAWSSTARRCHGSHSASKDSSRPYQRLRKTDLDRDFQPSRSQVKGAETLRAADKIWTPETPWQHAEVEPSVILDKPCLGRRPEDLRSFGFSHHFVFDIKSGSVKLSVLFVFDIHIET